MAQTDIFDTLHRLDGFSIRQNPPTKSMLMLQCVSYWGGVQASIFSPDDPNGASIEVASWSYPTPADSGACQRLKLVLDAVCRYLTTGGTWEEMGSAFKKMHKVAQGGLTFPGWYLMTSYSTTEGGYEHFFAKADGSDEGMLWSEPMCGESGSPILGDIAPLAVSAFIAAMEEEDAEPTRRSAAGPPDPPSLCAPSDS